MHNTPLSQQHARAQLQPLTPLLARSRGGIRSPSRTLGLAVAVAAAFIATGTFATQSFAQEESRFTATLCGAGVMDMCGEETTHSDCGWTWKGHYMPVYPYVHIMPWYDCKTETTKKLYRGYVKSSGDLDIV